MPHHQSTVRTFIDSVLRIVGRNRKRLHVYRCLEMKGNPFILVIDFGNLDRSDVET
jgi:hypothetical protein